MRELKDFEEDLYKCSRCALCQSVCPVYKATLNECAVSKGKFNMLNGVIKGELYVTKQMKKYLDMCTGCNACKNFCPSSIDAREIIQCAKAEYYKNNKQSFFESIFNSYAFLKSVLRLAKPCFFLYRALHLGFCVRLFEGVLLNCGEIGRKILLLNFLADSVNVSASKKAKLLSAKKIVFFDGCINKYINPQTEKAVFKILNNAGYKILKRNFECCGITFFSDGNVVEFQKIVNKNLKQLNKGFDLVMTDCASCNDVLKHYSDFSSSKTAQLLKQNTVSAIELIKNLKFQAKKLLKVAIHMPCHEEFDLETFVKNIDGIDFVEAKDYDKCCGFSGSFAVKNPKASKIISMNKAKNYIDANVDIVLTTCPSCMLGLEQGFIDKKLPSNSRPRVMNLFIFLAEYCSVS